MAAGLSLPLASAAFGGFHGGGGGPLPDAEADSVAFISGNGGAWGIVSCGDHSFLVITLMKGTCCFPEEPAEPGIRGGAGLGVFLTVVSGELILILGAGEEAILFLSIGFSLFADEEEGGDFPPYPIYIGPSLSLSSVSIRPTITAALRPAFVGVTPFVLTVVSVSPLVVMLSDDAGGV